jgi:hypothetical protein
MLGYFLIFINYKKKKKKKKKKKSKSNGGYCTGREGGGRRFCKRSKR